MDFSRLLFHRKFLFSLVYVQIEIFLFINLKFLTFINSSFDMFNLYENSTRAKSDS